MTKTFICTDIKMLSGREAIRKRPYLYLGKENIFTNLVEGVIGFTNLYSGQLESLDVCKKTLYIDANFDSFKKPFLVKDVIMELEGSLGQSRAFEKTSDLIICILTAISSTAIFNFTIGNDNYTFSFKNGEFMVGKKNRSDISPEFIDNLTLDSLENLHHQTVKTFSLSCFLDSELVQTCTCPDYWFPADQREELRKCEHGPVLQHHKMCVKYKEVS